MITSGLNIGCLKWLSKQPNITLKIVIVLFLLNSPILGFCENLATLKTGHTVQNLKEYTATYTLYWRGIKVGTSTHTLQKIRPDHFSVTCISKPLISFLPFQSFEKSEFYIKNHQIYPIQYTYNTQEKNKKKAGEIAFNQPNSSTNIAQDKISLFFQLRQDLALKKKNFRYKVIEPQKIKNYAFNITGTTSLETPLGTFETIQIEHTSNNGERLTKLWLAKNFDYLIIKLQQIKKGKITAESIIQNLSYF